MRGTYPITEIMKKICQAKFHAATSVTKFFDSKKDLKAHKDKEHRITNHKILKNKKSAS